MVTAGSRTRRRDEEERIILMKSRGRRLLDFIRIILSFSSSPDFSTKNVRICDKYVSIWCHGGDHSKWSNFFVHMFSSRQQMWKAQLRCGPWPSAWPGCCWPCRWTMRCWSWAHGEPRPPGRRLACSIRKVSDFYYWWTCLFLYGILLIVFLFWEHFLKWEKENMLLLFLLLVDIQG